MEAWLVEGCGPSAAQERAAVRLAAGSLPPKSECESVAKRAVVAGRHCAATGPGGMGPLICVAQAWDGGRSPPTPVLVFLLPFVWVLSQRRLPPPRAAGVGAPFLKWVRVGASSFC